MDNMIHIGGDEVSLDCWKASPKVQAYMRLQNVTDEAELWIDFEQFLLNYTIHQLHKQPILWQDVLDTANRTVYLPDETIIDVWKEWLPESRPIATVCHKVLYSACWYLDHLDQDWESFYRCDPRDFNGTLQQKDNVIGGHASMWGERVDETNFMSRVWPRAAVTAEKLWTGHSTKAFLSAYKRLERFRCFLLEQGMAASPIGPGSCQRWRRQTFGELPTTQ
jgi:hexosaminidase